MQLKFRYCPTSLGYLEGSFICKNNNPVSVYVLERQIATAALGKQLECSIHGKLKVMHMAPDLVSDI